MTHMNQFLEMGIMDAEKKLSMMSRGRLTVNSVDFHLVLLPELSTCMGEGGERVTGVVMELSEDPALRYLMLLDHAASQQIVHAVLGMDTNDKELADSVLQELGNVFGSTVANSLAKALSRNISTSVPEVTEDLSEAIVNSIVCTVESLDDHVWLCDAKLHADNLPVDCHICLFYDKQLSESLGNEISSVTEKET